MTISVYRDVAAETNQDHRWVRYSDVRMPVTVAEGEAALDLISTKIAGIEARLAGNPDNEPELTNALNKWGERLAEVEWTTERLRAGEAVPSMDLAKERAAHAETMRKLDAMRVQVKALESKATRLERHRSASDADIIQGLQTQNAGLLRAVEERNAAIERLRAAPKQPTPAAPDAREMKRRLIESVHEHCASGLEAFDELRAAGGDPPADQPTHCLQVHERVARWLSREVEGAASRPCRGRRRRIRRAGRWRGRAMTTESEEMERIFRMSDEELRWELRAEGLDPDEVAERGRALLDEVTARFHARKAAGE